MVDVQHQNNVAINVDNAKLHAVTHLHGKLNRLDITPTDSAGFETVKLLGDSGACLILLLCIPAFGSNSTNWHQQCAWPAGSFSGYFRLNSLTQQNGNILFPFLKDETKSIEG